MQVLGSHGSRYLQGFLSDFLRPAGRLNALAKSVGAIASPFEAGPCENATCSLPGINVMCITMRYDSDKTERYRHLGFVFFCDLFLRMVLMGKIATKYTTIWEKMFLFLNLFQASNKQIQDKYNLYPCDLIGCLVSAHPFF